MNMRKVKERKPVSVNKAGLKIYNLGFVDCYQKPWYIPHNYDIKYYGRFAKEGYPGEVHIEFEPLRELINKIKPIEPKLKDKILLMIEELEDAHYAERDEFISGLPSAD